MQNIFLRFAGISLSLTPLVLALLLLARPADKRFLPKWRLVIWAAVCLRLLLPFSLIPAKPLVSVQLPQSLNTPFSFYENGAQGTAKPPVAEGAEKQSPAADANTQNAQSAENSLTTAPHTPAAKSVSPLQAAAFFWLGGAFAVFFHNILQYLIFKRKTLRWAAYSPAMQNVLSQYTNKKVIVLVSNRVQSPLVFGLFKNRLVLPDENFSENELEYIFRHEVLHIEKGHLWLKLLMLAACCVHWFNPFIWVMASAASKDMEISCDTDVAENFKPAQKKEYCDVILRCTSAKQAGAPMLSTYLGGSKNMLKKRITSIFTAGTKKKGFSAAAVCLALLLCSASLVGCALAAQPLSASAPFDNIGTNSSAPSFSTGIPAEGKAKELTAELWSEALWHQRTEFKRYAESTGANMGYHVANVAVNTSSLPQGLNPHGFTADTALTVRQLLAKREEWADDAIAAGWLATSREDILTQDIAYVHSKDDYTKDDFILYLLPPGNLSIPPVGTPPGTAAFSFGTSGLNWFCNPDTAKIFYACNSLSAYPGRELFFGSHNEILDAINSYAADSSVKPVNVKITRMETEQLRSLNDTNPDNLIYFIETEYIKKSGRNKDTVKSIYAANMDGEHPQLLLAMAFTDADIEDAAQLGEFISPYLRDESDVMPVLESYFKLYSKAQKLV